MTRSMALALLGLSYEDLATIRRAWLRQLARETDELIRSFR
jgi:hypothetical protein